MKAKILLLIYTITCASQSILGQYTDTILIQNIGSTDRGIRCINIVKSSEDEIKEQVLDSLSQLKFFSCNEFKLQTNRFDFFRKLCSKNKFISYKAKHDYGASMITVKNAGNKYLKIYLSGDKSGLFFKWLSKKLAEKGFNQSLVIFFRKRGEMLEKTKKYYTSH
jgi:hypothetical protein